MNDYNNTWDALGATIGAAEGKTTGSFSDMEHMTIDQRLKACEIAALLSISQELSRIHHDGINPQYFRE